MKTKILLAMTLSLSSAVAMAEMPGAGMAGDMVKDAATDAVKEKITDTAKDMIKGKKAVSASESTTDKKTTATEETATSSTQTESTATEKTPEAPK